MMPTVIFWSSNAHTYVLAYMGTCIHTHVAALIVRTLVLEIWANLLQKLGGGWHSSAMFRTRFHFGPLNHKGKDIWRSEFVSQGIPE